ncbi:MAG: (Fe-S)-binding protein [Deltaproteobacteria bacterium]|nr:(Fe-S)-binding protein [Deltaproteobacteria bacterium]
MNSPTKTKQNKLIIAKEMLGNLVDRRVLTALEVCVRCGICTESCHYYQSNPKIEHTPYYRAELVRRLYRRFFDPVGRVFPQWFGAGETTEDLLSKLAETAFSSCTLCQRCTLACPFGVETAEIMRITRSVATATGNAPDILVELANAAIAKEENAELFRDIYLDQIKDLEKEVQDILGSSKARIPVGEKGARMLYVPLAGAHTIVPQAVLFNIAQESWTLGMFEASNYAVFLADGVKAKHIAERITKEAEQVKAKEIIIAECGHAYTTMRWDVPKWRGSPLPFKVRSIIEVLDEYVREGRLHLDSAQNSQPTTYHDSCNLGRKGGIFEEPRRVIRAAASDYREMTPNRLHSYCCGGGSGLVAVEEWADIRLQAGKLKAEQIRQTGAKIVVTSCDNCRHQIKELSERHDLGIEVTSVSELAVKSLA